MHRHSTILNQLPDEVPPAAAETTVLIEDASNPSGETDELRLPAWDNPDFARHFEFICHFSGGGVGVINKARDRMLERVVAVKELREAYRDDPEAIASFLRECRLSARLDHPAIVPIYDLGRTPEGGWTAAMKFINGVSFNDFIQTTRKNYDRKKRIPPFQEHHALLSRLEYFLRIGEVIEYAHSMNIVHGDLKPDNIMMGHFGELYVMDWGCARYEGSRPQRISGTPNYLPPEFLTDKVVSRQNDIFALGMILFELTTLLRGRSRLSGNRAGEETDNTCTETDGDATMMFGLVFQPEAYRHYLPQVRIDRRLKAVILKAVHPDATQRYQSVKELSDDVRRFIYNEEIAAAPDRPARRFGRFLVRHKMLAAAGATLLLLLPVLGWGYSAYRATQQALFQDMQTVRRLRLQTYTDSLYALVSRNLHGSQALLLLFADNLLENLTDDIRPADVRYSDEVYRDAATAPQGMLKTSWYPQPINLNQMVVLGQLSGTMTGVSGGDYVRIAKKILQYNPGGRQVNPQAANDHTLLSGATLIHRLIAVWTNGTAFSYPGSYENPQEPVYAKRFFPAEADPAIRWNIPYAGLTGQHRLLCRYALFSDDDHRFLGEARLELRLEKILEPLLNANAKDPIHELFFIASDGTVLQIAGRELHILREKGDTPGALCARTIRRLAHHLAENNFEQFTTTDLEHNRYVSGNRFKLLDAMLLQMIDVKMMEHHQHTDLNPEP